MARLPVVTRDQVPEQFREAFDEMTAESAVDHHRPGVDNHQQPGDGPSTQPCDPLPAVRDYLSQAHPGTGHHHHGPGYGLPLCLERACARRPPGRGKRCLD